ncbi:FKBP-type peptidyl-prolyl cis-trans isomerase [Cloacibacillus evryensis]|uniref:FKBP-type peptidyl-prolyl cis-trans isomerase n=1 Tax=Cloacibacillus evryensis TaxID=508460 RepID=UPI003C6C404A
MPAKLGYGNQALPGIPPNSTLIFDVEMVDVDPAAPAPATPEAAPAPSAPAAK